MNSRAKPRLRNDRGSGTRIESGKPVSSERKISATGMFPEAGGGDKFPGRIEVKFELLRPRSEGLGEGVERTLGPSLVGSEVELL